uniref:4-diphosphocytidyl-2-C-methyl-D-erythritol kinase n=1 Tax=Chlorobium chlorochromatii (strain CaD3) TaxID=340177 RepID=ISPE_CHLCH|nr:RecName: Full=4-diphosphocytidyl-2-C-methyl-D-erythritol kinase; Short=CMK; AltName: Full=4-(cytidine-5'-diphospho)-2-C-methyl-D-erythritol kinase [Chlorobium chlorochromatii CaD3]
MQAKAFAKINLGLFITGKRPDGYHNLETIFAPINWYDTITFEAADTISMSCTNLDLPVDENNLCIKAARALQQAAGVQHGIAMTLEKKVPFGAGLGGGSSDAATVLRVLNHLWQLNLPHATLHNIAVKLGADVPYFLFSKGIAYAGGIGDELEDLQTSLPFAILTVFPNEHIATVWAYKNFYRRFELQRPNLNTLVKNLCTTGNTSALPSFENDFEAAVFDHFPTVRDVKTMLMENGALYASLSGSGSALFGLFANEAEAYAAIESLPATYRTNITPARFVMDDGTGL